MSERSELASFRLSLRGIPGEVEDDAAFLLALFCVLDFAFYFQKCFYISMEIINRKDTTPFITLDKSEIRELLAHRNSSIKNQSLAEATLPVGATTQEHFHKKAEEIYYVLQGKGKMRIEDEVRDVAVGDAIAILPGSRHKIQNTGKVPLVFLCCCAPCYEHEDTVLIEK